MTIENLEKIRALLQELTPDPTIDFGPAYEGTKARQKEALKIVNQEIRWMKQLKKKL